MIFIRLAMLTGLLSAMALSACMGTTSQTTSSVTSQSAMSSVLRASQTEPTSRDLAMTCKQIDSELGTVYAKFEQINKAERAREKKTGLTSGLLNAGISLIGAGAITDAGSAGAIGNIGTATTLAGSAANASVGSGGPDAKAYNQALALQERAAVLERAKIAKGC